MMTRTAAMFFGVLAALAGCNVGPLDPATGGSDTGSTAGSNTTSSPTVGSSSGVPRTLALAELTSAQASALCEWTNLKQGGYGQAVACGLGRPESTDASNSDCVTASALIGYKCPSLTVANEEDCINATGTILCLIQASPACAPINDCRS
jgi:hypothetical protein